MELTILRVKRAKTIFKTKETYITKDNKVIRWIMKYIIQDQQILKKYQGIMITNKLKIHYSKEVKVYYPH